MYWPVQSAAVPQRRHIYQGACAAVPTPAVNVQLFSSTNSITAVVSQSADGAICRYAAINDRQMQKVQLALCDAGMSKLPCSGEDPLRVFDVWPEEECHSISNTVLLGKGRLSWRGAGNMHKAVLKLP